MEANNSIEQEWTTVAAELGVSIVMGELGPSTIEKTHRDWMIRLEFGTHGDTKSGGRTVHVIAPYLSQDNFMFYIRPKTVFTRIQGIFNRSQIQTGIPAINQYFSIQTNDPTKFSHILDSPSVRGMLSNNGDFSFGIITNSLDPEGMKRLSYETFYTVQTMSKPYSIKQPLQQVFDVIASVLDKLCRIGSAENVAPQKPPS